MGNEKGGNAEDDMNDMICKSLSCLGLSDVRAYDNDMFMMIITHV